MEIKLNLVTRLQNGLIGAAVGAIAGPVVGGMIGFIMLSLTWFSQEFVMPGSRPADFILLSGLFAVLIAPIAAGIGVVVGIMAGMIADLLRSRINAGNAGGFIGALIGTFASLGIFGGEDTSPITIVVAILTLAFTGFIIGATVKYIELRRKSTAN